MDIPGMADGLADPEVRERAEAESERLIEELKEKVDAQIDDVGTLRKKLTIRVPEEVIQGHLDRNFRELRSDAVVPGFRKGRAPLALVQKRFGADVRESSTTTIVGQAYFAVVEKNEFEVLGDPRFIIESDGGQKLMELGEALEHMNLPATGDFSYACEIEVKPTFELPELKGIEVKAPVVEIGDDEVNEQILRQQKIRGRYTPVTDGGAQRDDMVVADARLMVGDAVIKQETEVQLPVRPTRSEGILLEQLEEQLTGAVVGDERNVDVKIPDDYERTDLRGKDGRFTFKIHEIKRLEPAAIGALTEHYGAQSENELKQMMREDMEAERDRLIANAKKEQVLAHLLENVELELPEDLSARQTNRAVSRKIVDLQQRGVPQSEIESQIDALHTSAREETARSLRLDFILEKVAETLGVEVTDEEVNTEIARIARMYGMRFDRVRDNLASQGLLDQLAEQIRQDKCVQMLLADAKVTEVTREQAEAEQAKDG